jgi:uncharacterized protein DUF3179
VKRLAGILLLLAVLTSLAWVLTPVVIIRPFVAQTPGGLALAYALRHWSRAVTLTLLVVGGLIAVRWWPRLAWWKGRALAGLGILLLAASAYLAHQNHFEWMFRPLPHPEFVAADRATSVAADDLVLGVAVGTEARAYPVRAMAYHHLVNDEIAGEPIVATY